MEFLNKKEEVIDLVLTRRGKELLGVEGFNPHYYAFYDDEILYDKSYGVQDNATLEEQQNEAESRIRNTVMFKAQSEWTGSIAGKENLLKGPPDFRYNSHWFKPLGRSTNFNNYKPAWNIQVLEGYISGSGRLSTDSAHGFWSSYPAGGATFGGDTINSPIPPVKFIPFEEDRSIKAGSVTEWEREYFGERIPQLQLYCDYLTLSTEGEYYELKGNKFVLSPRSDKGEILENLKKAGKIQESDNYAVIQKRSSDNFVFSVKEENVDESDSENFTLEIFEYEYDGTYGDSPAPRLKRLFFSPDENSIETVEYYFNIITDDDVDEKLDIKYIYDKSALAPPKGSGDDECG